MHENLATCLLDVVFPARLVNLEHASAISSASDKGRGLLEKESFRKGTCSRDSRSVIFFSLTEAPLPDPAPTPRKAPETDPKQTRSGAKRSQTDPKRSQPELKWTEIKPSRVGRPGGLSGWGGGGGCKGKRSHYPRFRKIRAPIKIKSALPPPPPKPPPP